MQYCSLTMLNKLSSPERCYIMYSIRTRLGVMIYLTTDLLNERNEYGDKQRKLVEVPEVGVFYPLVADYSDVRLSLPNKPGGLVPAPDITLCVLRDREHKIYEDFTAEDIFLADKLGSLLSCFAEVAIWAEGVDWNDSSPLKASKEIRVNVFVLPEDILPFK